VLAAALPLTGNETMIISGGKADDLAAINVFFGRFGICKNDFM
jgi:hypothetical protein